MEFTKLQKQEIMNIIDNCTDKEECLQQLKLYLIQFKDLFFVDGLDYTTVAYTIWKEYANKRFI